MAQLTIFEFGHPVLRKKAKPLSREEILSSEIQELISDMQDTIDSLDTAAGIAAPQVGHAIQLSALDLLGDSDEDVAERIVIINPAITSASPETEEGWEGCLSFPGLWGKVPRAKEIEVSYLDQNGNPQKRKLHGFNARVVQHEVDHLNGILFVDRMEDMTTLSTDREAHRQMRKEDH